VRICIEAVSLDSNIIMVHPDGTGVLKNAVPCVRTGLKLTRCTG